MNTTRIRLVCLTGLVFTLLVAGTSIAQSVETADDVLDGLRANAQAIEDLDATLTVTTYADGEVSLEQRIRLSLLQPNRMRQEYLEPEYLAGNLTLVVGDNMWIYIAAVDTWYEKDLSELSTAEQPWLVFRQYLRDVQDEFDDYTFELVSSDDDVFFIRGVAATDDAVYGRIELWVDKSTFVPQKRRLYDVDGNLLVESHILEVERVGDVAYLARGMENYDEDGILQSTVHYDEILANIGLDPALFEKPEESDNGA